MVLLYKILDYNLAIQTLIATFDNRVLADEYIKKCGTLIKDAERISVVDLSHIPHNPKD